MIAGMDEIVEYIKTLEKENKELKEENKELKEENKELQEENKELQELKQQVEEECGASVVCKKMIDEIRDLQEELDILKETEYDFKKLESTKEYDKYYEIDPHFGKELIMSQDEFFDELSKIVWGSKNKWVGFIECLQSVKRYKSYFMKNRQLNIRIKELKKYAKYKNELLYSDEPNTLKQLNRDIDNNY